MDRKLKTVYLADVAAFGLFLFGHSINNTPIVWISIATGLPLSSYLVAKVPSRKQLEDSKAQRIYELESQLTKLLDEKSWNENLNYSQVEKLIKEKQELEQKLIAEKLELEQKLLSENNQKSAYYKELLQGRDAQIEQLKQQLNRETTKLKTEYSGMIANIETAHKAEIEQLQVEYSGVVTELSQQLEQAISVTEQIKEDADNKILAAQKLTEENNEIKQQLRYQAEQQELARRELSLEERRIHVELTNERALLQKQIDDGLIQNERLKNIIEVLEVEKQQLAEQVAEYHIMLFQEKCDDNYSVKMVQKLLLEADINTEFLTMEEKQDGKVTVIFLRPISAFNENKLKTVCDQLPGFLNLTRKPTIEVSKGRLEVRIDKRSDKEKALANRERLEKSLISIDDCVQKNLGFLVIGEPGSAKSTGALYIANAIINQELSQKGIDDLIVPDSAMLLAFDIHHSTSWDDAGIKVIDNPLDIYQQFKYLQTEYDNRKPGNKTNRLIIFFDEMAETLDRIEVAVAEKEGTKKAGSDAVSYIQNLYRSFGTGGRKKYINFVGMNHSYNVKALGIDGYYRNCFVSILLNDACRHYINTTTKHLPEGKKEQFWDWLELMSNRYIALATGAIDDRLLKHPTHHDYPQIKDGNPPKNLQPVKQLPLDIKLV